MSTTHVPAWKRLGFKLKFANDSPTNQHKSRDSAGTIEANTSLAPDAAYKRKSDAEIKDSEQTSTPVAKKARLIRDQDDPESKPESRTTSAETVSDKQLRRKKSVKFTDDTKIGDGDSAQTIQVPLLDISGSMPLKTKKKEKKPKAERQRQLTARPSGKHDVAMTYLKQHYSNRADWKFNKNREIWILKHALSTSDLPHEINAALANYVRGLKSDGARQRLKLQSVEERSKSDSSIDPSEESNSQFYQRLRSALSSGQFSQHEDESDEFSEWLKAQSRSAILLWALDSSTKPAAGVRNINGQTPGNHDMALDHTSTRPRAKKNKARTLRNDIDVDSSSESDSSSDETTSSEDTSSSESDSDSSSDSD